MQGEFASPRPQHEPDQAWCADITYIPVMSGFFYLVAVMDWATRHVLSWQLSNTMEVGFCLGALEDALLIGTPGVFNTDQGSQFTSLAFTERVLSSGARVSMDGRGRFMDNIFIERLWRSLKYEAVYLHELVDGHHARRVISSWIDFYNHSRPHSSLHGRTPASAYLNGRGLAGSVGNVAGGSQSSRFAAPPLRSGPSGDRLPPATSLLAMAGRELPAMPTRRTTRASAPTPKVPTLAVRKGFTHRSHLIFALELSKEPGPPQTEREKLTR